MSAKMKKPVIADMTENDRRESYEMLRAAHTLLRMAYGCIALFSPIDNEKDAKILSEHFNYVFKQIESTADGFIAKNPGAAASN